MLILQIILTVLAWKKGWKWYSFIPISLMLILGFSIGFFMGATNSQLSPFNFIWLDIIGSVVLILMAFNKPKNLNQNETTKEN